MIKKETQEYVICVTYVNKAVDCNEEEDTSEFGKSKPNFLEIYKDLIC